MTGFGGGLFGGGVFGADTIAPFFKLELDVTNKPTNPVRVWTDVTSYNGINRVRSANWTRAGRATETERTQGGTAQVVLDNRDGIFNRDDPAGPFYPALARSFWFRISVTYAGVTYVRWTGIKQDFPKSRPASGKDHIATLIGADAMKVLELFPLSELSYPDQAPGARVAAVLADVGCAIGSIDAGKPTLICPAVTFAATDTTSGLSHLQAIESDERGLLFAQADGSIDFQDRTYRSMLTADPGVSGTIGEASGDIRYVDADLDDNNEYLWNTVAVTPSVGAIQVAVASASWEDNFQRRLDQSMLAASEPEALSNAQWYAQRYSAPLQRLGSVEILGGRDPATWPVILNARNSDLFAWEGGGNTASVFLERVTESYKPGEPLRVTWDLSPAARDFLWQLGVPGQSELGVTTRLS
jgi:hypothetical protein